MRRGGSGESDRHGIGRLMDGCNLWLRRLRTGGLHPPCTRGSPQLKRVQLVRPLGSFCLSSRKEGSTGQTPGFVSWRRCPNWSDHWVRSRCRDRNWSDHWVRSAANPCNWSDHWVRSPSLARNLGESQPGDRTRRVHDRCHARSSKPDIYHDRLGVRVIGSMRLCVPARIGPVAGRPSRRPHTRRA